ncbi:hypothetical protein FRC07_005416 [Ceratobasidium sp. 392]|nr:hypothetical protein FRC07_005416 [Ceratobasidium sp. 392]
MSGPAATQASVASGTSNTGSTPPISQPDLNAATSLSSQHSARRNGPAPTSVGLVTSTLGTKWKARAGLKALKSALSKGSSVFGPFKSAVNDVH